MKRSSFLEVEGSKNGSLVAQRITKSRLCGVGFFSLVLLFVCLQLGVTGMAFYRPAKEAEGLEGQENRVKTREDS